MSEQSLEEKTDSNALLFEVAWEVCQQVGGIYTVIRTKAHDMIRRWGDQYFMIGPYDPKYSDAEFEPCGLDGAVGEAARRMSEMGFEVHTGHWLCTGRPRVILLNSDRELGSIGEYKYYYWKHHDISVSGEPLVERVIGFGFMVERFLREVSRLNKPGKTVAHFHEWMAASAIPEIRRNHVPVSTVFTTHATMLGRYIAMNDFGFYDRLPWYNWLDEAKKYNIETQVRIERAAAHGSQVFTTVSDITAEECRHLIQRKPDVVLPNGLNIERFVAMHEFQNLHKKYKERIHEFVMAHFMPSYNIDLDNTLYFFTSGRYEFKNKGYDLTLEALARLNYRMKKMDLKKNVVFFLISKRPSRGYNAEVLNRRAQLESLRNTCRDIVQSMTSELFQSVAAGTMPDFNNLVEDFWKLRMRQFIHGWKVNHPPTIVTHDLYDDSTDEVLSTLRTCQLFNLQNDPLKVIYHPDFISANSPLFRMDYDQFVRGCHLGVFPSAYEPWGYTPLECIARGIPAVTSDLAGFGSFLMQNHDEQFEKSGLKVIRRRSRDWHEAADELANYMLSFVTQDRRERINQRNRIESLAERFDWSRLGDYYEAAHKLALNADLNK